MGPQILTIECLKMYKIFIEVMNTIRKAMKNWNLELLAGGQTLVDEKISSWRTKPSKIKIRNWRTNPS